MKLRIGDYLKTNEMEAWNSRLPEGLQYPAGRLKKLLSERLEMRNFFEARESPEISLLPSRSYDRAGKRRLIHIKFMFPSSGSGVTFLKYV